MVNVYVIGNTEYWATELCLEGFKNWYLDRYAIELEDKYINIAIPEKTIFFNENINHLTLADYLEEIDVSTGPVCVSIIW